MLQSDLWFWDQQRLSTAKYKITLSAWFHRKSKKNIKRKFYTAIVEYQTDWGKNTL